MMKGGRLLIKTANTLLRTLSSQPQENIIKHIKGFEGSKGMFCKSSIGSQEPMCIPTPEEI